MPAPSREVKENDTSRVKLIGEAKNEKKKMRRIRRQSETQTHTELLDTLVKY